MSDCLQLFFLRCFVRFLRCWPLKCVCALGRCLGVALHVVLAARRKIVRRNLQIVKTALQLKDSGAPHGNVPKASSAGEILTPPVEQLSSEVFKRSFMHLLLGFRLNQACFQKPNHM